MEQKEKLLNLLNDLATVIDKDERIESFECIGSVKENCITNHSDLDITINIESENFVKLFKRKELEKVLSSIGLKVLAIYYDSNMCIGLFNDNVIVDIVFKFSDDVKVKIEKPKDREEILADVYRIFWLDCFYFLQLLDDDRQFRWEAIRGLNTIRERHILKLLFIDRKNGFPSFKKLSKEDEKIFEELANTLPKDDSKLSLKHAFKNLITMFNSIYKNLDGPIIPEVQELEKNINNFLMLDVSNSVCEKENSYKKQGYQ